MKLPNFLTNLSVQTTKAWWLVQRLWRLKITKVFLVLLLLLAISPFILFIFLRPKPATHINYGITFSNKYASDLGLDWRDTYLKSLDDLQVKNLRLVAYWDDIESTNNVYNFEDIRWQLDEAQKRNVNVILVLGYKTLRYPECFAPEWWEDIESQDVKDAELFSYVRATVKELQGYDAIKMWQVENEPFFPFGECETIREENVREEVQIVRNLDSRSILTQDSGEGGLWKKSYEMGDYLGISMYRKIWYDFWGALLGNFIYFEYPLAHWTYKIKADLLGIPYDRIIVTELQGEPWGPAINSVLPQEEKDKSFSRADFINTISYAQKAGFKDLYLWGAEWWLWEKERNNNPFFWDTAKALFTEYN